MQKTQENQLYIFDPKALHQIVVKVRSISPHYLPWTPFSTRIKIFMKSPHQSLSTHHSYFRSPSFIETHFLEETSLYLAPDFLEHLVSTFTPIHIAIINKVCFPGKQHHKQRKMLNPVFSIVHLRDMSKLWPFSWSPRTERAIAPTLYCIFYKVHLHLNLSNWCEPLASFETHSLGRWRMVHRRLWVFYL